MSANETCSTCRVGKHLLDMSFINNCLKQGDAFSPQLFTFALVYAIWAAHVNQDGLKLNGTHQLLIYADVVNIRGGSVHIIKQSTEP